MKALAVAATILSLSSSAFTADADNVKPVVGTVLHAALDIAGIKPDMLQSIPEKK